MYTYTHTYIYICMYVCMYTQIYLYICSPVVLAWNTPLPPQVNTPRGLSLSRAIQHSGSSWSLIWIWKQSFKQPSFMISKPIIFLWKMLKMFTVKNLVSKLFLLFNFTTWIKSAISKSIKLLVKNQWKDLMARMDFEAFIEYQT